MAKFYTGISTVQHFSLQATFFVSVTNIASHVDDDTLQAIDKNMIDTTRRLSLNLVFAGLILQ